jgi:hypothetical protein
MKPLTRLMVAMSIGSISFIVWSCKDEILGPKLSDIVFPSSNISYQNQVQPLFNVGCGGQNNACHGPLTFDVAGFSLDDYLNATSRVDIIVRGTPDASKLILVIEGKAPPKMPPTNQPQLNTNQIQGLRKWVQEGARGDN